MPEEKQGRMLNDLRNPFSKKDEEEPTSPLLNNDSSWVKKTRMVRDFSSRSFNPLENG